MHMMRTIDGQLVRVCQVCGDRIARTRRADKSYCSARCRVRQHRRMRNAGVTDGWLLNLADSIVSAERGLAEVESLYGVSTCAGWSADEEAAFQCMRRLFAQHIAELKASRDSMAAGGDQ